MVFIFIFYWFGGLSLTQDSIMLFFAFLFLEFIKWLQLFLFFLSKYR
jgi:hypothetical protein